MVTFWYSEPIEKIRVTADPGGEALTIAAAQARREELQAAIQRAIVDTSRFEIDTETDETVVVTDGAGHTYRFSRVGPVAHFESWRQHGETYSVPEVPEEVVQFLQATGYRVVELE